MNQVINQFWGHHYRKQPSTNLLQNVPMSYGREDVQFNSIQTHIEGVFMGSML